MNNFTKNKHLRIMICYGSQNGYAESLAFDIYKSLSFIDRKILPMNEVIIDDMNSYDFVIFVISTNKLGSFPDNSNLFYNKLNYTNYNLSFKYFIIGIGDSSYDNFCEPAKKIDTYLSKTKSKKCLDNMYLDDAIDHEEEYLFHKNSLLAILKEEESNIKKWFTNSMNKNIT